MFRCLRLAVSNIITMFAGVKLHFSVELFNIFFSKWILTTVTKGCLDTGRVSDVITSTGCYVSFGQVVDRFQFCMLLFQLDLAFHLPFKSISQLFSILWVHCYCYDKYQKPHVLVAKLFTIVTRTCSGSYAISWLECRQTNMFDAKTVILY